MGRLTFYVGDPPELSRFHDAIFGLNKAGLSVTRILFGSVEAWLSMFPPAQRWAAADPDAPLKTTPPAEANHLVQYAGQTSLLAFDPTIPAGAMVIELAR